VGLVEQHDFAFGTSSRSSRLLHGGMRYLAQGRIGFGPRGERRKENRPSHRAASGRAVAVHLSDVSRQQELGALAIEDRREDLRSALRRAQSGQIHLAEQTETLEKIPGLAESDLNGAVRYYDGFTNDARLVLDTLRSAARSSATVVNYCRFQNANWATRSQDEIWECEIEDRLTQKTFTIGAHHRHQRHGALGRRLAPQPRQAPHHEGHSSRCRSEQGARA
jgi:glycerol-3-phosphate dehydrogenase